MSNLSEENKLHPIDETKPYDQNKLSEKEEKIVSILRRQTNYNIETILEKMDLFNNNIEKIILDYNNVNIEERKKNEFSSLSTNQKIFKSIRDFF